MLSLESAGVLQIHQEAAMGAKEASPRHAFLDLGDRPGAEVALLPFIETGVVTFCLDRGDAGLPQRVPSDVATAAAGGVDLDLAFRRRCSNFGPEQVSVDALCRLGSTSGTPPEANPAE